MITHHIYGDESGDFRTQPYFVLGCVKTANYAQLQADLDAICNSYSVPCEVKYSSTNRLLLPVRKAFIDTFFSSNDTDFRCIVKSRAFHDPSFFQGNHLGLPARDMAYNRTYAELLKNNILAHERVLAYLDDRSRTKKDNLFEYLRANVAGIADAQPRDSKSTRILQLADLLTGCVFGDLVGTTHPVKRELQEHVLGHLGCADFGSKIAGTKFNLWHWKPRK